MNRARAVGWWRTGVAALRKTAGPLPHPSRWAWAADAFLAAAIAVGTLDSARARDHHNDLCDPTSVLPTPTRLGGGIRPGLLPPDPPRPPLPGLEQYCGEIHFWQPILALLVALPLVARRRYPLATFWVVILATHLFHADPGFDPTFTFAATVIAAYSAMMYSPYRLPAIASALVGAGLTIARHGDNVPSLGPGLTTFMVLVPIGLAANAIHVWRQRIHSLEAQREAATRLAVEQERSRIARELHDVVTHSVSVMVVQAGAARKVMDTAPEQAREALLAVESGGRAAMAELRHVMGLLTMSSEGADPAADSDLAPQPGLDRVPALAARVRGTGVPVELTVTGPVTALPAGPDLAAYRVVQEALTNAVKHAAGASVRIAIEYAPDAVRVDVTDTGGTAAPPAGAGDGRGLIGLRERLAVYGGTLEAGRRPTGGYRVRAVIPMGGS